MLVHISTQSTSVEWLAIDVAKQRLYYQYKGKGNAAPNSKVYCIDGISVSAFKSLTTSTSLGAALSTLVKSAKKSSAKGAYPVTGDEISGVLRWITADSTCVWNSEAVRLLVEMQLAPDNELTWF